MKKNNFLKEKDINTRENIVNGTEENDKKSFFITKKIENKSKKSSKKSSK